MLLRLLLAAVVAVVAAGFLWIGAERPDGSYSASLWANLGTTLLLALPLIVLERMFTRRVKEAEESLDRRLDTVQTSVDRLDALSRSTAQAVDDAVEMARDDALGPARRIVDDPSYTSVRDAIYRASTSSAIAEKVFVPLPDHGRLTLSFAAGETSVFVGTIPAGRPAFRTPCDWDFTQSVQDFFVKLNAYLRAELGASAPKLVPEPVLTGLARMIELAEDRRLNAARDKPPSPLIELASEHWLITEGGLEHISDESRRFSRREVSKSPVPPQSQIGVAGEDEFRSAWIEASVRFTE